MSGTRRERPSSTESPHGKDNHMAFPVLLEFLLWALILVGMFSQIILPLINGTILFPLFRSKMSAIESEKRKLKDQIVAAQMKKEIEQLKETLQEHFKQEKE